MRAPRTTWLLVTITPRRSITTPEASPLLPVEPDRLHVDDAGEHARDDVGGASAAAGAAGAAAAAVVVLVTVTTLVAASFELLPQAAAARPTAAAAMSAGSLTAGADSTRGRARRRRARSSAASADEREAQLAPLVLVPEPRGEVLVDGIEARLALGREELATGGLRDLPQRDRVGRHRTRESAAVEHAVGRAERDGVDRGCRTTWRAPRRPAGPAFPRVWAPSESSRIAESGRFGSGGGAGDGRPRRGRDVAVASTSGLQHLDRARERVADRGSLAEARIAEQQAVEHELPVVRQRRRDVGLGREHDQPDAVAGGKPGEEAPDRLLRGTQPRRLDVIGGHRARDVDRERDRGLLAGHRHSRLGPRERSEGARQRQQRKHRREQVAPASPAGRDGGQHLDVRVVDRVAGTTALDGQRTRAPRAARAGARAARVAIRSSPRALRLHLDDGSHAGARPRRGGADEDRAAAAHPHDADGGELGRCRRVGRVEPDAVRRCCSRRSPRLAGERRAREPARRDRQLRDAHRDRLARLDGAHARERHRRARPATAAGDAADEGPVARGPARAPCIGALEEQRLGGRDARVDGAADAGRGTRRRPLPRWPWRRLRRRCPAGRRAARSRSRRRSRAAGSRPTGRPRGCRPEARGTRPRPARRRR